MNRLKCIEPAFCLHLTCDESTRPWRQTSAQWSELHRTRHAPKALIAPLSGQPTGFTADDDPVHHARRRSDRGQSDHDPSDRVHGDDGDGASRGAAQAATSQPERSLVG